MFDLNIIKSIILGIIEGITEWLPISSTGHLVLFGSIINLGEPTKFLNMYDYVIQFGAIMAVIVLYFSKLNPFSFKKTHKEKRETWSLWMKVLVAIIPSVVIGLPLNDWMDEHLMNNWVVADALIIYGILFIFIEYYHRGKSSKYNSLKSITFQLAFFIGCFQALSIIPGTSRSGATILGAIILGTSRYVATEFSFFMAIPTMFGIFILKFGKFLLDGNTLVGDQLAVLLVGMFVSFIVSLIVIKFLMGYLKKHDFTAFGWYRIILGILIIIGMSLQILH